MMKYLTKKNVIIFINTFFIIFLIFTLVILIINTLNKNISTDENMKYTLLIGILPIIFGFIGHCGESIFKVLEQEKNSKQYWFREFILDSYLNEYIEFINQCKKNFLKMLEEKRKLIESGIVASELPDAILSKSSNLILNFNLKYNEIISSIEFIKIYNIKFSESLLNIFENVQNIFIEAIDMECRTIDTSIDNKITNDELEKQKVEIMTLFYKESIR